MWIGSQIGSIKKNWVEYMAIVLLTVPLIVVGVIVPINYDEAYNMQVVDHLVRGQGYSTNGSLIGAGIWRFDPHITTGPVPILFMAIVHYIAQNVVISLKIYNNVVICAIIGASYLYAIRDRKPIKLTLMVVIMLGSGHASNYTRDVEITAARFIGEPLAIALIFLALYAIRNGKIILTGICAGLLVQTKLPIGIFLAGIVVVIFAPRLLPKSRKVFVATIVSVTAPSLLFVLYVCASAESTEVVLIDWLEFMRSQRANRTLVEEWRIWLNIVYRLVPGIFIINVVLALSNLRSNGLTWKVYNAIRRKRYKLRMPNDESLFIAAIIVGSVVTNVTHTVNFRTTMAVVVIVVPVIWYWSSKEINNIVWDQVSFGIVIILSIVSSATTLVAINNGETIKDQLEVSRKMVRDGIHSLFVDGWWQNPEYILLTGIPASPVRSKNQALIVQEYQAALLNTDAKTLTDECVAPIAQTRETTVCYMKDVEKTRPIVASFGVTVRPPSLWEVVTSANTNTFVIQFVRSEEFGPASARVYTDGRAGPLVNIDRVNARMSGVIPAFRLWGRAAVDVSVRSISGDEEWKLGRLVLAVE